MTKILEPSLYPDLIKLINTTYTDRVEKIVSAQLKDDGSIECTALDGPKRLRVKITGQSIMIGLAPKGESAQFAAEYDPLDHVVASLSDAISTQSEQWLETIKDVLSTSDSPEEAQAALFALWPKLEGAAMAEAVGDAMAAASLHGYFDSGAANAD